MNTKRRYRVKLDWIWVCGETVYYKIQRKGWIFWRTVANNVQLNEIQKTLKEIKKIDELNERL